MSAINPVMDLLRRSPAIRSAVRGQIYPLQRPQAEKPPAIVLTLVSEVDERHLLGSNRLPVASIIIDTIGTSYEEADDLGESVKAILIDYRGTVSGVRIDDIGPGEIDHFDADENGKAWRRRLGFYMRYRAA